MTAQVWIGVAQAPLVWVVVCEVFFLAYLVKDKGVSYRLGEVFKAHAPMIRMLLTAVLGALAGYLIGRMISDSAGWIGFAIGTLPACVLIDRLLAGMRPKTRIWRWFATPLAAAQALLSLTIPGAG
ncbi:MAG: hypothetical protein AAF891_10310 [Pseudomonadota bacterium]